MYYLKSPICSANLHVGMPGADLNVSATAAAILPPSSGRGETPRDRGRDARATSSPHQDWIAP